MGRTLEGIGFSVALSEIKVAKATDGKWPLSPWTSLYGTLGTMNQKKGTLFLAKDLQCSFYTRLSE